MTASALSGPRRPCASDGPHCDRSLEYTGERLAFCGYCGQPLEEADPDATAESPAPPPDPGETVDLPSVPPPVDDALPAAIGQYRLLRELGKGGMGTVWEAEESPGRHRVALKLISPEFVGSREAVERFRQEGRLASRLSHPRCVFVLGADEEGGRPYIVMELMPGRTLQDLVEDEGPLAPRDAVARIADVIDGLEEAHKPGLIHRDVKPSNCEEGRVKIRDFGLSKSLAADARLTQSGTFLGTPLYASPEQVRAEKLDPRSDVYSVAATLYYLLTGKAPFQGAEAAQVLARIVSEDVPPMRGEFPQTPPALERAVLKGLEREPRRRWQTLGELREALSPFAPGEVASAGRRVRFAAYVIDSLVFLPFQIALATLAAAWENREAWELPVSVGFASTRAAYFVLLEGIWGASLGKRTLRLRVSRGDGTHPIGVGRWAFPPQVRRLLRPRRRDLLPRLALPASGSE